MPGRAGAGESHVTARTTVEARGDGAAGAGTERRVAPQLEVVTGVGGGLALSVRYELESLSGEDERTVDVVSSASAWEDRRHALRAGARLRDGISTLELAYRYATANTSSAHGVEGSVAVELLDGGTSIAFRGSHDFAEVEARVAGGAVRDVFEPLDVDRIGADLTQALTPSTRLRLAYSLEARDGFQASPFRELSAGDGGGGAEVILPEALPELRIRHAGELRGVQYLAPLRAAFRLAGGAYRDSWEVQALSAETAWDQYLGEHLLLRGSARLYDQSAASFFRDRYEHGPVEGSITGDPELAGFGSVTLGLRAAVILGGPEGLFWAIERADLEVGAARTERRFRELTVDGERASDAATTVFAGMSLSY